MNNEDACFNSPSPAKERGGVNDSKLREKPPRLFGTPLLIKEGCLSRTKKLSPCEGGVRHRREGVSSYSSLIFEDVSVVIDDALEPQTMQKTGQAQKADGSIVAAKTGIVTNINVSHPKSSIKIGNRYKTPESVLVVIYCQLTGRVLMLQRNDDQNFWQSVTGSLEAGEIPPQTAVREVHEETGIDIHKQQLSLIDADYQVEFEIFPQFRHRYAPGVTRNLEHWFYLNLPNEQTVMLTEHTAYQWLNATEAAQLTKSPNNRQAIEQLFTNGILLKD